MHVNDVEKRTAWLRIRAHVRNDVIDVCKQTLILSISITYKIAYYKFNELVYYMNNKMHL